MSCASGLSRAFPTSPLGPSLPLCSLSPRHCCGLHSSIGGGDIYCVRDHALPCLGPGPACHTSNKYMSFAERTGRSSVNKTRGTSKHHTFSGPLEVIFIVKKQ